LSIVCITIETLCHYKAYKGSMFIHQSTVEDNAMLIYKKLLVIARSNCNILCNIIFILLSH